MTSRASKLFVAALLASSIPAAALAHEHDCDHDRDGDDRPAAWVQPAVPPPAYQAPAGYGYAVPPPAYETPAGYGYAPSPPAPGWREHAWREHRIHELRAELRELEARRAEVHARWGWNPGRLWRFDRWYAARRAELERRLDALAYVAWR